MPESKSDKQTESVAAKEISDEPDQRQEPETLETRAKAVLKNNDKGLFTIPLKEFIPISGFGTAVLSQLVCATMISSGLSLRFSVS